MMKRKILLVDVIQYLEADEVIQVGVNGFGDWDAYTTFMAGSPLLKPFYGWRIDCMGTEFDGDSPAIRVTIISPE